MHAGRHYTVREVVLWTRTAIVFFLLVQSRMSSGLVGGAVKG